MNFGQMLYTLIIGPLELSFEFIFSLAYIATHNHGFSILALSIVVNILVLPLYNRADELQQEEKNKQRQMDKWMRHIKKNFRGDEKMLIQQAYYRVNDYHPIYVVKSSVSLLLQIPFFIAAYHFLSNLTALQGAPFGPLADLGAEDAALSIGKLTINVLPVLMTLINIISGTIYSKGSPLREKIQLYTVSVVFLVLLYHSPSGLVFYWTLNNLFSLGKHIVKTTFPNKKDSAHQAAVKASEAAPVWLFFASGALLAILTGGYIPINVIKSSVAEFASPYLMKNPVLYLVPSLLYSSGFFVLWLGVFFMIAGKNIRTYLTEAILILTGIFVTDHMFFKMGDEVLNPVLQYFVYNSPKTSRIIINTLVIAVLCILIHILYIKRKTAFMYIIPAGALAILVITISGCVNTAKEFNSFFYMKEDLSAGAEITLSRDEKNVIVFMFDRAIGPYIPYIAENEPELMEQYDGFTYYPNTVSYGGATIFSTPSLFGGYEYTPMRINQRTGEKLQIKNDEALKVLPTLFDNAGFDVTVCDPPYAGYQWFPDLSIYDDLPDINTFNLELKYNPNAGADMFFTDEVRERNFFCYALMTCSPLGLRKFIYNNGLYHKDPSYYVDGRLACIQVIEDESHAYGLNPNTMNWYYALENLPRITTVNQESRGGFVMIQNGLTHEPMLLQRPDYEITSLVDNSVFDLDYEGGYEADGVTMKMDNYDQISHFQTNILALKEFAEWMQMLKDEGVYDNTRIILVSDHGRNLGQFDNLIKENEIDIESYSPLLLVKDFNSKGFNVSEDFMTLADVPGIALNGIIENAKNPFSGNPIDGHEKEQEDILIITLALDDVTNSEGDKFPQANWYKAEREKPGNSTFSFAGYW